MVGARSYKCSGGPAKQHFHARCQLNSLQMITRGAHFGLINLESAFLKVLVMVQGHYNIHVKAKCHEDVQKFTDSLHRLLLMLFSLGS